MGARCNDSISISLSTVILSSVPRSEESFKAEEVRSSDPAVTSMDAVSVARSAPTRSIGPRFERLFASTVAAKGCYGGQVRSE